MRGEGDRFEWPHFTSQNPPTHPPTLVATPLHLRWSLMASPSPPPTTISRTPRAQVEPGGRQPRPGDGAAPGAAARGRVAAPHAAHTAGRPRTGVRGWPQKGCVGGFMPTIVYQRAQFGGHAVGGGGSGQHRERRKASANAANGCSKRACFRSHPRSEHCCADGACGLAPAGTRTLSCGPWMQGTWPRPTASRWWTPPPPAGASVGAGMRGGFRGLGFGQVAANLGKCRSLAAC